MDRLAGDAEILGRLGDGELFCHALLLLLSQNATSLCYKTWLGVVGECHLLVRDHFAHEVFTGSSMAQVVIPLLVVGLVAVGWYLFKPKRAGSRPPRRRDAMNDHPPPPTPA